MNYPHTSQSDRDRIEDRQLVGSHIPVGAGDQAQHIEEPSPT